MKTAEEWQRHFAITRETYRQKNELLMDWEVRRYKMIQADAERSGYERGLKEAMSVAISTSNGRSDEYAMGCLQVRDNLISLLTKKEDEK